MQSTHGYGPLIAMLGTTLSNLLEGVSVGGQVVLWLFVPVVVYQDVPVMK